MIIVITGPTCLGKSNTALNIAKILNAEIVNGDAFQSYKDFDVGVAKPPKEYFSIVPHHLYSFVDPSHSYSIMEYQKNLRKTIDDILSRNKIAIIVGGSGLYIRSGLYDYTFEDEKEIDMSQFEKLSDDELHDKLKEIDEVEALKIHPHNRKRVLRALQIFYSQNQKKSDIIAKQNHELIYDNVYFFVKDMPRDILYERINKRVDEMVNNGLIDEFKNLYKKYGNVNAMQAIGYKELIGMRDDKYDIAKRIELIKQHTRNYAKRQMTFIRHQFPVIFYKDDEDILKVIKK